MSATDNGKMDYIPMIHLAGIQKKPIRIFYGGAPALISNY